LLTISLVMCIVSASGGFRAVIRAINKAYGFKDERKFYIKLLLSFGIMLIFTFSLILMMSIWLFNNEIMPLIQRYLPGDINTSRNIIVSLASLALLIATTAFIFYLAKARRDKGRILPGACITVVLWLLFSQLFSLFVNHFSNISAIYGSIAGVFVLLLWINFICMFLLLGNTVNAILKPRIKKIYKRKEVPHECE